MQAAAVDVLANHFCLLDAGGREFPFVVGFPVWLGFRVAQEEEMHVRGGNKAGWI
jgi:hypothetical protein